jgi:hypothetical protein
MAQDFSSLACWAQEGIIFSLYQIDQSIAGLTTGCLTVQGCATPTHPVVIAAGTTGAPLAAATEASLAKLPLAQGTALAGLSGPLVQGSVTTAAPTYTTGQIAPLSVTTGGALRVTSAGSGVQDTIARGSMIASASIAAGFKCITIFTSTDWVGTVAGVTFPANATETYPAPTGDTLSALAVVRTAGTLYYSTIG